MGDVLPANREVATLILPEHLWVRVYVPEPWLGLIKLGEQVRVRVDSFPGKDFDGVVEQINRQAEFTPRNVQTVEDRIRQVFGVKIRLPNDDDHLRAGMCGRRLFSERNELITNDARTGEHSGQTRCKVTSDDRVRRLTKRFGTFTAVDHVTFSVGERIDLRISRSERFRQIDRDSHALRHSGADAKAPRASAATTSSAKATRSRR